MLSNYVDGTIISQIFSKCKRYFWIFEKTYRKNKFFQKKVENLLNLWYNSNS